MPAPIAHEFRVGPGAGKLEVHYTAIRLRSPERTRFKYWMEGFDPEWTDAGQRRIAYYTNMPPGDYRFHVVAYELNDPRHAAEQVTAIRWLPHFYQTAWFLAVCVLLFSPRRGVRTVCTCATSASASRPYSKSATAWRGRCTTR